MCKISKTASFKLDRWLPVFLWAIVIFIFSSIPQIKASEFFVWDFIAKKTTHIAEYAILLALIFRATENKWFISFTLTLLYALSDELHQSFVTGRQASIYDLGFDLSGASIASYTIWKLKAVRQKRPKK